jgi:hypothetical protein
MVCVATAIAARRSAFVIPVARHLDAARQVVRLFAVPAVRLFSHLCVLLVHSDVKNLRLPVRSLP